MKKESITRFRLDPRPPKADWEQVEAMSEQERHDAVLSDPDAATERQLDARSPEPTGAAPTSSIVQ